MNVDLFFGSIIISVFGTKKKHSSKHMKIASTSGIEFFLIKNDRHKTKSKFKKHGTEKIALG